MKKILLLLLLLPVSLFAQNQGGVIIVGGVAVHQPDTSAYKVINTIQAEGTQLNGNNRFYITYLVAISKRDSLWQKSKAFYGFIGGTSASHKWNWKDMRNVDGAFRIIWNGTVTHSSLGAISDGTTGYGDTRLIQDNNSLTVNNNHLSFYSGTSTAGGASQFYEMGQGIFNGSILSAIYTRRSTDISAFDSGNFSNNRNSFTNTNGSGYYLGKVNSDLTSKFYKNGFLVGTKAVTTQASLGETYVNILGFAETTGGITVTGRYYSNKQCRFATIGSGLTDQQAIQSSNTVAFAQGIVGRK